MVQARKTLQDWIKELKPSIDAIKQGIADNDLSSAYEAWAELSDEEKKAIWVAPSKGGPFTTEERSVFKSDDWNAAKNDYYSGDKAA
jgi:hypothetical protein